MSEHYTLPVAKPKITPSKKVDVADAAAQVDIPAIKWKVVAAIVLGVLYSGLPPSWPCLLSGTGA